MRAILTLCLGNLVKRKLQNTLISLLIALSALLVSSAFTVLLNTENVFEDRHSAAQGAHEIINMTRGLHDEQKVTEWWSSQEGVTASRLLPYKPWTGLVFKEEELPNLYLYMINTPAMPHGVNNPLPGAGPQQLSLPEPGEIWVPTSLAYKYNMQVGDELVFTSGSAPVQFKIGAIVIDISHGGPFSTTARIWMNEADYQSTMGPLDTPEQYMLSLRFEHPEQSEAYWKRFEESLGSPFLEERVTFAELSAFYFIMNKVIGFVMSFLGLVMILVALLTIGFTITDTILANYRTIGILKSIGMTSRRIIGTYLLQYGLMAIVALVPALMASRFLSDAIIQNSLSFLKSETAPVPVQAADVAIWTGCGLLLIILLCVLIYAAKTRHIEPIQAIRFGMSESAHSRTHRPGTRSRLLDRWSVPAVIAWKQVSGNKKSAGLILFLMSITVAVLVFGAVLINSVYRISDTSAQWGYDDADIAMMVINAEGMDRMEMQSTIESDPRVLSLNWSGSAIGVIAEPEGNSERQQSFSLPLTVVEGSMDEMGFASLSGRNPVLPNEISIGINIARKLKKDIGDILTIYIEGKPQQLLITGTFQSISNMSNTARVTSDLVEQLNPDAGFIQLKNPSDRDALVQQLNDRYGPSIQALKQEVLLDSVFKEAAAVLLVPMSLLALLFMAVTCLIVYTTCRLHIRKETKTYGIYASLGLTAADIRRALTSSIAGLAALGSMVGIVCGAYALPAVLRSLLSNYGIVKLPLIMAWPVAGGLALIALAIAVSGCWLASRILRRASLRVLVLDA
ncbi:ABC transporter permease [Paenibacillus ihbetae]|uniref:ABC transporter permease n=1 Tax=Paenibacillus ihbetae TaxID=1870820 RepID=A0A1B2DUB8_9BACL|nr:FtsX-like permease family protein [Paenibacillus ihbetae]ANY71299.1 ABC transporter permease [Paenibacillus ihbetae]